MVLLLVKIESLIIFPGSKELALTGLVIAIDKIIAAARPANKIVVLCIIQ